MNILAISGSIRADSSNTAVLKALQAIAPEGVHIDLYEELGTLPHFDPGIQPGDVAEPVTKLRRLIAAADAVIICTPEYAFGVPGVLKNALDWLVSSGEMNTKPLAAISASPMYRGGNHAHASLVLTLTALGTRLTEDCKLMIPGLYTKMNEQKQLTDPSTIAELSGLLKGLIAVVNTPVEY